MWSSVAVLGGIAFVSALILGIASIFFAVEVNPKVKEISEVLPGANCGGCGFPGCSGFAEAVVAGNADLSGCVAGGLGVAQQIGSILGIEIGSVKEKRVARIFCSGGNSNAVKKYDYAGINDCRAAMLLAGGPKACAYACIGLGTCIQVCHFGAISMGPNNIPVIDPKRCTSCGMCVAICPKQIIRLVPESQDYFVLCSSHDKGKKVKEACSVGCIACQLCVKKCPSEALIMDDSLAVIDPEKCTSCGTCWKVCPQKTIWTDDQNLQAAGIKPEGNGNAGEKI